MKGSKSKLKYFYSKFIDLPLSQGTSSSTHTDDGIPAMADRKNLKSLQGKKLGDHRLGSGGKLNVSQSSDVVSCIGL